MIKVWRFFPIVSDYGGGKSFDARILLDGGDGEVFIGPGILGHTNQ